MGVASPQNRQKWGENDEYIVGFGASDFSETNHGFKQTTLQDTSVNRWLALTRAVRRGYMPLALWLLDSFLLFIYLFLPGKSWKSVHTYTVEAVKCRSVWAQPLRIRTKSEHRISMRIYEYKVKTLGVPRPMSSNIASPPPPLVPTEMIIPFWKANLRPKKSKSQIQS